MSWENVNSIEKVWEAMTPSPGTGNVSAATTQRAQIFRENINALVNEFGGRKEFMEATGVNPQALSHWQNNGVSAIIDKFVQVFRGIGIEDPEELFILPLVQVARKPTAPAETSVSTSEQSATFAASETEKRVQELLNSPVRRHFRLVVDMLYNDLQDMNLSR